MTMTSSRAIVHVVDDDAAILDALQAMISRMGIEVRTYASAEAFLAEYKPAEPGCLIVDVRMPGMSGMQLHQHLRDQGSDLPVIIISGHGSVPMTVEAMKQGAVSFLEKPWWPQDLIDAIHEALEQYGDLA